MDKIQIIEKLFTYILIYSYLLPPLFFFLFKKKSISKESVVIALYGLIFFLLLHGFDIVPFKYKQFYNTTYTFLEYSFFSAFMYFHIKSKGFKKIILIASVIFVAFQIIFLNSTSFVRLDSIPIGIETIFLSVFIIYFFYEQFKNQKNQFIYNHPAFWLSIGILIYLGGSFFYNILIMDLTPQQIKLYEPLTFIGDILKNVLFTVGVVLLLKQATQKNYRDSKIPFLDLDMN